jgi:hypothetical protein
MSMVIIPVFQYDENSCTDTGIVGRRPIHEAIDCEDCVSYLVKECQVDVNAMKRGDWTPVMIAGNKNRQNYNICMNFNYLVFQSSNERQS